MPDRLQLGDNSSPRDIVDRDKAYVAFTIHPESATDAVYIDGELLGVGSAVYPPSGGAQRKVTPFRYPSVGNAGVELGGIVVQGWKCNERVVPASKRAPVLVSAAIKVGAGAGGETGNVKTLGAGYLLAMRVPFQGRRHASFTCTFGGGVAGVSQVSLIPVGIRYNDPSGGVGALGTFTSGFEEATPTVFNCTATTAVAGSRDALTIHVGGFDSEEHYDEIQFFVKLLSASWDGEFFIAAEANGERNG